MKDREIFLGVDITDMPSTLKDPMKDSQMKLLQNTIRIFVWSSIFIVSLLLIDWIGREVILNLPW